MAKDSTVTPQKTLEEEFVELLKTAVEAQGTDGEEAADDAVVQFLNDRENDIIALSTATDSTSEIPEKLPYAPLDKYRNGCYLLFETVIEVEEELRQKLPKEYQGELSSLAYLAFNQKFNLIKKLLPYKGKPGIARDSFYTEEELLDWDIIIYLFLEQRPKEIFWLLEYIPERELKRFCQKNKGDDYRLANFQQKDLTSDQNEAKTRIENHLKLQNLLSQEATAEEAKQFVKDNINKINLRSTLGNRLANLALSDTENKIKDTKKFIEVLLDAGLPPNTYGIKGCINTNTVAEFDKVPILTQACNRQFWNLADILLNQNGIDVNNTFWHPSLSIVHWEQYRALSFAIYYSNTKIITKICNKSGQLDLYDAVRLSECIRLEIDYLRKKEKNNPILLGSQNKNWTPLMIAIAKGDKETAKKLLEEQGWTPLMIAIAKGDQETAEKLFEKNDKSKLNLDNMLELANYIREIKEAQRRLPPLPNSGQNRTPSTLTGEPTATPQQGQSEPQASPEQREQEQDSTLSPVTNDKVNTSVKAAGTDNTLSTAQSGHTSTSPALVTSKPTATPQQVQSEPQASPTQPGQTSSTLPLVTNDKVNTSVKAAGTDNTLSTAQSGHTSTSPALVTSKPTATPQQVQSEPQASPTQPGQTSSTLPLVTNDKVNTSVKAAGTDNTLSTAQSGHTSTSPAPVTSKPTVKPQQGQNKHQASPTQPGQTSSTLPLVTGDKVNTSVKAAGTDNTNASTSNEASDSSLSTAQSGWLTSVLEWIKSILNWIIQRLGYSASTSLSGASAPSASADIEPGSCKGAANGSTLNEEASERVIGLV